MRVTLLVWSLQESTLAASKDDATLWETEELALRLYSSNFHSPLQKKLMYSIWQCRIAFL